MAERARPAPHNEVERTKQVSEIFSGPRAGTNFFRWTGGKHEPAILDE